MVTNEERIAVLEANDRNIFHQLDEHKLAIENIQRLVISVEKIADKTNSISDKVDQIDERLNQVEQQLYILIVHGQVVMVRLYYTHQEWHSHQLALLTQMNLL